MDGDEQFPDKQSRQAKEQDCSCHRQKHHQNVWTLGAIWMEGGRHKLMSKVHTGKKISHKLGLISTCLFSLSAPHMDLMLPSAAAHSSAKCYEFSDSEDTVMLVVWRDAQGHLNSGEQKAAEHLDSQEQREDDGPMWKIITLHGQATNLPSLIVVSGIWFVQFHEGCTPYNWQLSLSMSH